jgi:hypothetical protein
LFGWSGQCARLNEVRGGGRILDLGGFVGSALGGAAIGTF